MVKQLKKKMLISGNYSAPDTGLRWSVLWDTTQRPEGRWSTAEAKTETEALERAAHFRRLGFSVHAINDPSGVMVMDSAAIEARLHPRIVEPPPEVLPERPLPSTEQACLDLLRYLVRQYDAGEVLTAGSVRNRLILQGVSEAEVERILSFAKDQGWLQITDGMLTLSHMGYARGNGIEWRSE